MAKRICRTDHRLNQPRVLGNIIVFGEAHLRRALKSYAQYYNRARTHLSLAKDSPIHRPVQRRGNIIALPRFTGLHHEYEQTG
jgi:hypothetical protein